MEIFETIIILRGDIREDKANATVKIYEDFLQKYSTEKKVKIVNDIGIKKLAYEIRGNTRGYYFLAYWQGESNNVTELERMLRTDDDVIKFMTVKNIEGVELLDLKSSPKSEQIDALDVLLGFAEYKKGVM